MEKFNHNIIGGEQVNDEFDKRLESLSIVGENFSGNVQNFKRSLKAAIDQESRGGYMRGTSIFLKMIIGEQKLESSEYVRYQRELKKAIKIIEQAEKSELKPQAKKTDSIKSSKNIMRGAVAKEIRDKYIEEEILGRDD